MLLFGKEGIVQIAFVYLNCVCVFLSLKFSSYVVKKQNNNFIINGIKSPPQLDLFLVHLKRRAGSM